MCSPFPLCKYACSTPSFVQPRPPFSFQSIMLRQMLQGLHSALFSFFFNLFWLLSNSLPDTGNDTHLSSYIPLEMLGKAFSEALCLLFSPLSRLPLWRKKNFTDSLAKGTWNTWEGVSSPLESTFSLHCAKSLVRKLGNKFNWEHADYVRMSMWLFLQSAPSVIKVIYWSPCPWPCIYLWNGSNTSLEKVVLFMDTLNP